MRMKSGMKGKNSEDREPPICLIIDVDGVMTTGQFLYSAEGKVLKVFGPHDADGLKMLKGKIGFHFITADRRGYEITKKRIVEDMGYRLELVSEEERFAYLERIGLDKIIFIGDGIRDAEAMRRCAFAIAPRNARKEAKEAAHFVTESDAGQGAVLDACLEILRRFFPEERKG